MSKNNIYQAGSEEFLKIDIPSVTVPAQWSTELLEAATEYHSKIITLLTAIKLEGDRAVYHDSHYSHSQFNYYLVQPEDLQKVVSKHEIQIEHIKEPVIFELNENYVSSEELDDYFFPEPKDQELVDIENGEEVDD